MEWTSFAYETGPFHSGLGDLCEPNPCGRNAQCQPGYDNTGKDRPVCTCLPGYVGNGVVGCVRGECTSNYDCPDHSVCSSSECVNACSNVCGVGATCEPRKHTAVCACPSGYTGNPTVACDPIPYSKYRAIRF
uniref:(California timema) hypothetical protein n=1 Tax=Timema californicum TaxID=61474 RepID=A0A7R9JL30_TIMCA|nr:unnamed protein product [Timema californicum]